MCKCIVLGLAWILVYGTHRLAGQNIDQATHRASFMFSYKTKCNQTAFAKEEIMYLDIGTFATRYFGVNEVIRDSVKLAGIRQGLSPHEIEEKCRNYRRGIKTTIYTNFLERSIQVTDGLIDYYCYEDQLVQPKLVMSQESKIIVGYYCKEAKANYRGRNWTVYFTEQIAMSYGPWNLWGLPGMIVEAYDDKGYFHFLMQGFESLKEQQPLVFKHKNLTGENYPTITKSEFQRLEKLFYQDFVEFTRLFIMEGKGSIILDQEQKYRQFINEGGLSYIPLER